MYVIIIVIYTYYHYYTQTRLYDIILRHATLCPTPGLHNNIFA